MRPSSSSSSRMVVIVCGVVASQGSDPASSASSPAGTNASIALPPPDAWAGTRWPVSVNMRTARELAACST